MLNRIELAPDEPHTDSPTGREPDYVRDYMSIPPPPPPFTAGKKRSYLPLWLELVISILLAGSIGLYALTRYIPASKSQPTPTGHAASSEASELRPRPSVEAIACGIRAGSENIFMRSET